MATIMDPIHIAVEPNLQASSVCISFDSTHLILDISVLMDPSQHADDPDSALGDEV